MILTASQQYPPRNGNGRIFKVRKAIKPEATHMMVNIATRVGFSHALALIALAGLMMIVNG